MRKISDILKLARQDQGLSLDEVEQVTKIKKNFLRAIENGDFTNLPSESYALGYVKNYAKFLDIPESQAVPLFRREYSAKHSISIIPNFRKTQTKFNKKFFMSSKGILIIIAFVIVVGYIFLQYNSLFFPPQISIISPKNGTEISGNVVEVMGETDPYATVTVDGEEVFVNLKGEFRKSIYSFSGDAKIEVVAKNRYGKESREIISVKVK